MPGHCIRHLLLIKHSLPLLLPGCTAGCVSWPLSTPKASVLRPSSSHGRPRAEHLSPDLSPGIPSFRPRLEPARSPSEPSPSLLAGVPGRRDQAAHRRSRLLWLFQWMKDMWRSDPCYAEYGVDGSTCSFFIYLSEVSSFLWLCGVGVDGLFCS